ncbi:MAG: head GIN domain-containing protein, partial [Bacteroidales bacterium]
ANLIPHIRTIVNGNTLVIDTRENLDPVYTIKVIVKMPSVQTVRLSGSGSVTVNDMPESNLTAILSGSGAMHGNCTGGMFKAVLSGSGTIDFYVNTERVETTLSGSGAIHMGGATAYANHLISGSGNIDSYSMVTNECDCKISGSGNMYLWVIDHLNATISGSGSVFYHGSPMVNTNITGSGTVIGN